MKQRIMYLFWENFYATGYTYGAFFMRQGTGCREIFRTPLSLLYSSIPPPPRFHLTGKVLDRYKVDPALERFTLLHNNSSEESAVDKQGNLK